MYFLSFLFLTLPLYFSHIFMHFGLLIWDGASFERQKMYLFFLSICIALAEIILWKYDLFLYTIKKYWWIFLGFSILPFIPIFLYNTEIDVYWIRGSYEKFHGYVLYIWVLILSLCLFLLDRWERILLMRLSFIPLGIVSFLALWEWIGFSLFLPAQSWVWWEGVRAISTLGNPNYLAGYLLIMSPLVIWFTQWPLRFILGLLVICALIVTKSYIGIIIMVWYLLFLWLQKLQKKYDFSYLIFWGIWFLITAAVAIIWYFYIPHDKFLSLVGRFVLMHEIWANLIQYPSIFIFWAGPESVLRFFSDSRTEIVDMYFPHESIIDSSHNIFLDIVFQYGVIPFIFLGYILYRNHPSWNWYARTAFVLGILFLSFNPYVVTEWTLLVLVFSLHDKR